MATLTQDQIKVLEQTRQRLVQLTHSLGSLAASLQQSDPLPSWSSLQSQASIISNNLLSVSEQLSEHRELLFSLVAYPGPDYPGKTQANVLEQLLRTKLDPRVEDWVARGRTAGASALENKEGQLSEHELAELWEWAPIEANMEARRRNWGGNFTLEEKEMGIQNVVTGLRRRLDLEEEEEAEEDEEEDEEKGGLDTDKMEVVASEGNRVPPKPVSPALPLDEVLRYMMTGAPPKSR
ncbi:putative RNA polymerase II mediator complex component Med8 [Thermoascus aurantiacus ATCC 26904]